MPITYGNLPSNMEGPGGRALNSLTPKELEEDGYMAIGSREDLVFALELARRSGQRVGKYRLAPGLDLSNMSFENVSLYEVDFAGADLRGADLRGARLINSDFTDCDMRGIQTNLSTEFADSKFDHADLSQTELYFPFSSQSFQYANLEWTTWTAEAWSQASKIDFTGAKLRRTDFTKLGNKRLGSILTLREASLAEAKFAGADLRFADLSGSDLRAADLRGADLSRTNLQRAIMTGTDLSGASLQYADLTGADLAGANLENANLRGSSFRATLSPDTRAKGADISGAKFEPYLAGEIPGVKQ